MALIGRSWREGRRKIEPGEELVLDGRMSVDGTSAQEPIKEPIQEPVKVYWQPG